MPYCTRLTVTTAIRKNIESIRTQTQDHDRFDAQLTTFGVNVAYFIARNLTGSYSDFLTSRCVELLEGVLVAIMAYFQDLKDRLEVFKPDDKKILNTNDIKLAKDLARIAGERGRSLEKFLRDLNMKIIDIVFFKFCDGRRLDTSDQFAKLVKVIQEAKTPLSTL